MKNATFDFNSLEFVFSMEDSNCKENDSELNNQTAIEAITEKLTEVTNLAEEVDQALQSAHQDCAISTTSSSTSTATTTISVGNMNKDDLQIEVNLKIYSTLLARALKENAVLKLTFITIKYYL